MVQTIDFFPPVVDDPYAFGQIAAANALSDVYAMGAKPVLAMNLLCYPTCLSKEDVQAILSGGASKVAEAGAVLAGGHTIQDPEPKYGLCVSGFVDPKKVLTNSGAKPGDQLILTKPLGIGVMTTAANAELITQEEFAPAIESMATLNKAAGEIIQHFTIHSCTDVTGFGLLGHAYEMADGSGASIRIDSGTIPIFPKALELANMGILPAGAYSNIEYVKEQVSFQEKVPRVLCDLLADPQTSGGLLVCVPKDETAELLKRLQNSIPWARIIGEVTDRRAKTIYVE